MIDVEYKKNCPLCGNKITYTGDWAKYNLSRSIKENWKCIECRRKLKRLIIPTDGWKKNCPICSKELFYDSRYSLNYSINKNVKCKSCSNRINSIGNKNHLGKHHTEETQDKLRKLRLGVKHSEKTKKKISLAGLQISNDTRTKRSNGLKNSWKNPIHRKKWIAALTKTQFIGRRCDIGQLELLKKWNILGFNFEPNYQIHTDCDLFYIDGYDKEKNVVLEYDSKYHNQPSQKEKDLIRQEKIIGILKPKKFWRYNSVDKKYINVLEREKQ